MAQYARVPTPGSFRVNSPDGFLQSIPEAWSGDPTTPGFWFVGSDTYGDSGWGEMGGWGPGQSYGPAVTDYAPHSQYLNSASGSHILPAVTRCLSVLVGAVVRTPWTYTDGRGNPQPRPLWVDDPMLLGGAPGTVSAVAASGRRLDLSSFWSTVLTDAILWGHGAFCFVEAADRTPLPGSLLLLNPLAVRIDEAGHVVLNAWAERPEDMLRADFDGRFTLNGQTWRVVILHGLAPNHHGTDDRGHRIPEGVLLRHFDVFRLGARISRFADGIYTSGVPSGYLTISRPNADESEAKAVKSAWMNAHGSGRRSVAVLNSSVSYTPIGISPVDGELTKMAQANRVDVAHAFGMSAVWLDEGMSGLSYSNSSERRADLVSLTAASWGESMTALVQSLLPFGWTVEVNWSAFTAPQTETLMPALVAGVQTGILTQREAREMLGLIPRSGPDAAWRETSIGGGSDGSQANP